mmetsp:Transcript_7213/g.17710  ORF Transcript_7213/g.17710 Transcript_7213/m.17710 type:complete len:549 (+) Transcript_7213:141-1787(+)
MPVTVSVLPPAGRGRRKHAPQAVVKQLASRSTAMAKRMGTSFHKTSRKFRWRPTTHIQTFLSGHNDQPCLDDADCESLGVQAESDRGGGGEVRDQCKLGKELRRSVRQQAARFEEWTAVMPQDSSLLAHAVDVFPAVTGPAAVVPPSSTDSSSLARLPPTAWVVLCEYLSAAAPLPGLTCRTIRQRLLANDEAVARMAVSRRFGQGPRLTFQSWFARLAVYDFLGRKGELDVIEILVETQEVAGHLTEALGRGAANQRRMISQVQGPGGSWIVPLGAELLYPAEGLRGRGVPFRAAFKVKEHLLTAAASHSMRVTMLLLQRKSWHAQHLASSLVAAVHHRRVASVSMLLDARADPDTAVRYRKQQLTARQVAASPEFQCAAISALLRRGWAVEPDPTLLESEPASEGSEAGRSRTAPAAVVPGGATDADQGGGPNVMAGAAPAQAALAPPTPVVVPALPGGTASSGDYGAIVPVASPGSAPAAAVSMPGQPAAPRQAAASSSSGQAASSGWMAASPSVVTQPAGQPVSAWMAPPLPPGVPAPSMAAMG